MKRSIVAVVALLTHGPGSASEPMRMSCRVRVPAAYQRDPPGWQSPTGESEAERYSRAYEAFWWNCIMVRADSLDARCR
ncbi:MAG TPA: hypothetical protein VFB89_08235, partial [Gemmatimonadales bacterium]|nr:hypothetical protein [Gemmatimonadales bacterium]